jgi:hypothetical protein
MSADGKSAHGSKRIKKLILLEKETLKKFWSNIMK